MKLRPAPRSVTCYGTPGKQKSLRLLEAFAAGVPGGAKVLATPPARLEEGAAAFYGVTEATAHLWRQAQAEQRPWWYLDNSYFDCVRGTQYRVTKNALQASGTEPPDWVRLSRFPLGIQPWRHGGRDVVIAMQSEPFLRVVHGLDAKAWLDGVAAALRRFTERPIVVRHWRQHKGEAAVSWAAGLRDAWAVVTHSSAAANEALRAGVPVFVTAPCAASPMAATDLGLIESPRRERGRYEWAAALAGRQWTLDEIAAGAAWRAWA